MNHGFHLNFRTLTCLCLAVRFAVTSPCIAQQSPAPAAVVWPLERTAYFIGERVPLAVTGVGDVKLEAVNADGRTLLYSGKPGALLLDTAKLAPGDYTLELNGARVVDRITLTSTLRKSAGSMQDEATPPDAMSSDEIAGMFRDSGLTACLSLASSDMGRAPYLDAMARTGALLLVNPDTRPTSFFPVGNHPDEVDGLSQRMILTAQANGRHPNFGGFLFGWDTTGYAVGGRKGLMTYWGWGDSTPALRAYLERIDRQKIEEFTRRTGLKPVSEEEYIAYLLSLGHADFAPAIDLPTKVWLEEIARYTKPMPESDRVPFEKRLDAWAAYLMGLYCECYSAIANNLRAVDPSLRNTASVQSDHCAVRVGQYFPSAYAPLDLQYQSTWNDQVGGPDYHDQWLLVAALLEMQRGTKPTWISNAIAAAHERAKYPGKFVRVAAHDLAFGGSGIGFSLEGFSNILGGMNPDTNWRGMHGKSGEADVLAGRDFLDRFATLATAGRGDHGVGILWSKTQYGRQHTLMGFGTPSYKALVALTRLGYTPRFVTEDEIAGGHAADVKALIVIGQTFPLPDNVRAGINAFTKKGGRLLVDGSTSIAIPGAEKIALTFPFSIPGKPHSWTAPNMVGIENDTILYARWHPELARTFAAALGETGHALLTSEKGADAQTTLLQIDGGSDAKYIIAVNDTYIATQADWYPLRERLLPAASLDANAALYDCTEEKALGIVAPVLCDLSTTTARLFAILPREVRKTALMAPQTIKAGGELLLRVEFKDSADKRFNAVIPFHVAITRPDGTLHQEFYRSTSRGGVFTMMIPIPANAPAGKWSVAVRSQLTGDVTSLPVNVEPTNATKFATALSETVVVRERDAIETMLHKGATVVLPVFNDTLLPAAEKVKTVLAQRGVAVEIRQHPATNTYTLAYDPAAEKKVENARADRGETIGVIRRETLNGNDWYSALSGYRFGRPVILLDLAGQKGDNPMAESLQASGILWPRVSETFPGHGRAVVQCVHWAFAPRTPALVIQAMDVDGLIAGAQALARLPQDHFTAGIQATKAELWRQYNVRQTPSHQETARGLSDKGLTISHAPQPFRIAFPGDKPPAAAQVRHPEPTALPAYPVPGTFEPKQYALFYRDGERFIQTATAEILVPDLRFSEAVMLVADVKQPGRMKIAADGVFRYSDRAPCWQAQWEDILNIRDKLIPHERRAMEIEVQLNGKPVGKLVPSKTASHEVALELAAGQVAKKATEEVVTQLSGEIELSAGRQELLLIHRNIVDGHLDRVAVGP